jgi:hypothetical protein
VFVTPGSLSQFLFVWLGSRVVENRLKVDWKLCEGDALKLIMLGDSVLYYRSFLSDFILGKLSVVYYGKMRRLLTSNYLKKLQEARSTRTAS